jgi:hypothetical protein
MPLIRGRYPVANEADALLATSNINQADLAVRQSFDWRFPTTDVAAALTTQVCTTVAVPVQVGDVITNVAFRSGATAAGTPTNWWFAVYNGAATPALLAQTADQTSTAWAANTTKSIALTTAQTVTAANAPNGVWYVACMVKATTVPSLLSVVFPTSATAAGPFSGSAKFAQTHGSTLTATAPATIASASNSANMPWAALL